MGIFDSYYDQRQYSGQGAGLIDRLLSQLQTQGQYQPSQGFGGNPMDANATMPAQGNAPIAVGDYMMPRIGSGFQQNTAPGESVLPAQTAEERAAGQLPAQFQPQAQQAAPQQSPLPQMLQRPGNGVGDHLMAGLQGFAGSGSLIGGIVNGISGLATGQRNDPRGQQQQMMRAQYEALIPILGEQKARLAVINPEMGKAMVQQALAGKQYGFTMAPDGTMIRTDAHAGTAAPVYQAGQKPTFGVIGKNNDGTEQYGFVDPTRRTVQPYQAPGSEVRGTVTGPDGNEIPIPPGVDRKAFVKSVSDATADALTGKKTEVQAKSEKFGNKMELAEKNLKGLHGEYTGIAGGALRGTEYLPGGGMLQSESYQKYKQARDNFITALLRDESGAAIGTAEFNRYEKELFPQPGEGAEVVRQKAEARRIAIEGMKKAAGPGYKSPVFDEPSTSIKTKTGVSWSIE